MRCMYKIDRRGRGCGLGGSKFVIGNYPVYAALFKVIILESSAVVFLFHNFIVPTKLTLV